MCFVYCGIKEVSSLTKQYDWMVLSAIPHRDLKDVRGGLGFCAGERS